MTDTLYYIIRTDSLFNHKFSFFAVSYNEVYTALQSACADSVYIMSLKHKLAGDAVYVNFLSRFSKFNAISFDADRKIDYLYSLKIAFFCANIFSIF